MATLAHPPAPAIDGSTPWLDRSALLVATTVAVTGELLVQRVFVRIAVHVPNVSVLRRPYEVVATSGSTLFTAATLLTLLALALTVRRLVERLRTPSTVIVVVALGAFPIAGVLAGVVGVTSGLQIQLALLDALALTVLGALLITAAQRWVLLLGALLVGGLLVGVASAVVATLGVRGATPLSVVGEAVLLVGALVAPLALIRGAAIHRREVFVAAAVAGMVVVLQVANPAMIGILMLWGLGLTGSLFAPIYWGAAGAIALTIAVLVRQHRTALALALLLIAMGGYGLHNTYQSTVQLLGLALLVDALTDDMLPRVASAATPRTIDHVARRQLGARERV